MTNASNPLWGLEAFFLIVVWVVRLLLWTLGCFRVDAGEVVVLLVYACREGADVSEV